MNHYTYNIINKTNGKYYIGMRSSEVNPVEDIGINYFGSSKSKELNEELNNDKSNFIYHIIKTYDSREDAYKDEERIHQKFNVSKDPMSYNIQNAGYSGFDRHGIPNSEEAKQKISKSMKEYFKKNGHWKQGSVDSEETKENKRQAQLGRKHSEETKDKIRQAISGYKHEVKTCPKCGISGKGGNMKRYHFDNCGGVDNFSYYQKRKMGL
jgi:hypothetical protein